MRGFTIGLVLVSVSLAISGCSKSSDEPPTTTGQPAPAATGSAAGYTPPPDPRRFGQQISPPIPVQTPPGDAIKTASGLTYKKLKTSEAGVLPRRNDTVLVHYTGWRQASGETFFTTQGINAIRMNLAQAAPGFTEALQLIRKGEAAMVWMPAAIGYKTPPPKPEALVYHLELVEVEQAPDIPEDVGKPPASATVLPLGTRYVVLKPGNGKDRARPFDSVSYKHTVWNSEGKMLDTTVNRETPTTVAPYKESPALYEILTTLTAGERVRFWADAEKATTVGRKAPGAAGVLCYELELVEITKAQHPASPTPPDVAKPPANAQKSPKGVFYKVLKAGTGKQHPLPSDTVKVHYTGWTTDGRLFDSSEMRGEPSTFSLSGVVAGWTDAIPLMSPGDRWRLWIPEGLAYKGQAGKPKGMLVFDVELLEVVAAKAP